MIHQSTDLVEYSTASAMAECYEREIANIRRLMVEIGEANGRLLHMFVKEGGYASEFHLQMQYRTRTYDLDAQGAAQIEAHLHRAAWAALVDKLDIRKLMSSDAQRKLNDQLDGYSRYSSEKPPDLPPITADNIMAVLTDMIGRSGEFLEEKIREEYAYFKPRRERLATDNANRLAEKIIVSYAVEKSWRNSWDIRHSSADHYRALDSIMHMLDGAGISEKYDGDLVSAIRSADITGKGESKYFKFACFLNGNLHLRFKRLDLLALFNQVAAGQNLPQAREERRGTTAV